MNYTAVILEGPDTGRTHTRALAFCRALAAAGHPLKRVFFFGAGVRIGLPWDHNEPHAPAGTWRALAAESETELVLCSASADRYGITEAPEGFVIAGLGALMEASFDSERVISFG